MAARRRAVDLAEALEDVRQLALGNADSVVLDAHQVTLGFPFHTHDHPSVLRRELDRVGKQVPEDLLNAQRIGADVVLLLDTYDTEAAAHKVVALAPKLKSAGIVIRGVRLDSGDLIALSKSVRGILDKGGLKEVTIFASGGLDEDSLLTFAREGAPIDGIGIGTAMTTSSESPLTSFIT